MPRFTKGTKRRTIVEETIPDSPIDSEGEATQFDVALETVEDTEALQEVLGQFGETNVVLKVLRQTTSGAEFCYQTDVLDEEFIQKNFGGGDYQVRVFIGSRYRKTLKIKIATRINPVGAGIPVPVADRHSEFLEKMVLALVSREPQIPVSQNSPSIIDLTQALSNIDNLRGKQESGIEMFMKGMEMAQGFGDKGPGDWKTDLIRTAKDALPLFLGGFGKPTPPPPGGEVITMQPNQLQIETMVREGMIYLKKKCIGGTDPNLIIDWICANAEEEQYQSLIRTVITTDFQAFAKIDPEIGSEPFVGWFKQLFDGIRLAFTPPDSMGDDTHGDVGDVANAGSDGEPIPDRKSKPNGKGGGARV